MWIDILVPKDSGFNSEEISKFYKSSGIVTNIINRFVKKVKVKNVSKIVISLYKYGDKNFFLPPNSLIRVVAIDKTYDISSLLSLNQVDRKKKILLIVEMLVKEASIRFNWEYEYFDLAFQRVRELNYSNKYIFGKLKKSKSRLFIAGIEIETLEDGTKISFVVFDKNNIFIDRFEIIKTHQLDDFYNPFLGKTKWIDNEFFVLINKEGSICFKLDILYKKIDLIFSSKNKSENELIDEIIMASSFTKMELVELIATEKKNRNSKIKPISPSSLESSQPSQQADEGETTKDR